MRLPSKDRVEYPDELTCEQMGQYKRFKIFHDVKKAWSYAKKAQGQIYTQIDEESDVVYSKGVHYVNRTGIYAVIK